ncbi:hypothetical protein ACQR16_05975 [Bradyrhizobium oligotrophicum]|uniref:hypothetical protein n=1 Tax=Bradyrhizobium oligotrophicum TaxID=44255 RepID=UPI003EBBF8CA
MTTIVDELMLRFGRHNDAKNAKHLLPHFERALSVPNKLNEKCAEAKADKHLSETGRTAKVRDVAPSFAPDVIKAKSAAALARRDIQRQRDALTPRVTDHKDVASAMLRLDLRQFLRGKPVAEIARLAEQNPSMLEAIFEGPAALSGLTDEVRGHILSQHLNKTAAPQMREIAEQEVLAEVLETAVAIASNALADAAGIRPQSIDSWLAEQAPAEAKAAAEALAAPRPLKSQSATPGPHPFDKILAEARAEVAAINLQ